MRWKLLTFDVNYTILRPKGSPGAQYAKVARTCDIHVQSEILDANYKTVWRALKKDLPNYGINQGMTSKDWWGEMIRRLFTYSGYSIDNSALGQLSDKLWTHYSTDEGWEPYAKSHDILEQIKKKGLHMAVISNFDERLDSVLKCLEFDQYFDFLVTSVSAQAEKPDPKMFDEALRKSGLKTQEVAHIGDDIQDDYWGARKVGISSFIVDHQGKYTAPDLKESDLKHVDRDFLLKDLSDILKVL